MIGGKKAVGIIAARMKSTRLPGKALMPLCGEPVLWRIVERLSNSRYLDESIIATTTDPSDDVINSFCQERGITCVRGSENDVLGRVHAAAKQCGAEVIYRGMGDSPLVDHRVVDRLLELQEDGQYDFVSNELAEPAYPVGFDASVFPFRALDAAALEAVTPQDREHVTLYLYSRPERFKIFSLTASEDFQLQGLRVTLDTPEDYELISRIYDALYPSNHDFSAQEVITFLRMRPELLAINAHVEQKMPMEA